MPARSPQTTASLRRHARPTRRARPLLGTFVEITVHDAAPARASAAIDRAFEAIARVHALMSPASPDSDLARLRRCDPGRALAVDAWTWRVTAAALEFAEQTAGVFDPTLTSAAPRTGSWRDVQVLPGRRLRLFRPVMLDFGGIAKGFAVDRAIDVLQAHGISRAMVNAGGDLRVLGVQPQPVVLRDPFRPGRLIETAGLADAALATSSNALDAPDRPRLLRPDGRPLWIGRGSVSVCAPTCMVADALCKVVAAIGPGQAAALLAQCEASALAITRRGLIRTGEERHAA
jgi:thiamine biosynthesis lipoprotein